MKYGMNKKTQTKMSWLKPDVQPLLQAVLEVGYYINLNPQAYMTYRTPEEQQELYEQGRTKKGEIVTYRQAWQSSHNYGVAMDIAFMKEDGSFSWDFDLYHELWKACKDNKFPQNNKLVWGGTWQEFQDAPHFEIEVVEGSVDDYRKLARYYKEGIYA